MTIKGSSYAEHLFLGMIEKPGFVTLAVLNPRQQTIRTGSFRLEQISLAHYLKNEDGRLDFNWTEDLRPVYQFLNDHVLRDRAIRVLLEAPRTFWFEREGDTPAAIFSENSSLFRVLCLICLDGYGVQAAHYEVPERQSIVAHFASGNPEDPSRAVANQPGFLHDGISSAYCELLFGMSPNLEQSAAVAALIAKNHGSYYYWTSPSEAPSSGDIAYYLRTGRRKCLVGMSGCQVNVQVRPITDDIEDVAIEYETARQRWTGLGAVDATKAALIHVSKIFNFDIRCYSSRIDALERDPRMVYPLPVEDGWVEASITALGGN